jgi:4-hydroxy-tetrahydrodipicolinate synthase
MTERELGQLIIPIVTPFKKSGEIDYEKACELAERLVSWGYCDSLVIAGTNGEFYALSQEERLNLFKEIKRALGQRVPLIAGTGAVTTEETIALTQKAEELGYDAALILPPYYGRPSQDEIVTHFKQVTASTRLPIIIYNIPIFTGVNVEPGTTVHLASIPNIIGIKEETALLPTQTSEILLMLPKDTQFLVYCGDDTMVLPILAQGGTGATSGGSHIIGDLMRQMMDAFWGGDIEKAISLHKQVYRFARALVPGQRVNPVPLTKAALSLIGLDVGFPRPPFLPPTNEELRALEAILISLGKVQ